LGLTTNIPSKDKEKHKGAEKISLEDEEGGEQKKKEESKGSTLHKAIFLEDVDRIAIVEERSDTV